MFDLSWLLIQLVPFLVICYLYIKRKYSFWSIRNVPGPKPIFPLGYHSQKAFSDPISIEHYWTQKYGKVYGVYTGLIPTLTITDHELIKQVLVRDFHLFIDRRVLNSSHEIWNQNLFNVESKHWKRIRSITSPTFTSGKLKGMYPLMSGCVDKLVNYLDKIAVNGGEGVINTKEVITGFTIDVIASTSFATETNANGDRTKGQNAFVANGIKFFQLNPLRVAAVFALPRWLLKTIGIPTIFPDDSLEFFVNLSRTVIQNRRKNPQTKRNDLIQLMMDSFVLESDLKTNNFTKMTAGLDDGEESPIDQTNTQNKRSLTEEEIIAQCLVFFVAGFETTAATIAHCIFELAEHPQIQQQLFEQLAQHLEGVDESDLTATCDTIMKIPFLEAVIKETLRKYPPVVRIERRLAVNDYKLGGIPLEKDVLIEVPTVSVHYNPEYYPEPDRFNPDRFMPENKHLLVPYTYLPFGAGPRNCVGMRFAYQEIKLCLARMVQRYHFSPSEETPRKLEFLVGSFMLNSKSFPVKVTTRI